MSSVAGGYAGKGAPVTKSQVGYNTFYFSWHDAMEDLTLEQYGRVSKAINDYCFFGKHPDMSEFSAIEKSIYKMSVPNVDSSNAAKMEGKKGGKKSGDARKREKSESSRDEGRSLFGDEIGPSILGATPLEEKNEPPFVSETKAPCGKNRSKGEGDGDGDGEGNGEKICGHFGPPVSRAPEKTKPGEKPPDGQKKPPLSEREPENDHERVEKVYRQNWDRLYAEGRVQTPDPIVNWVQTRRLLSTHFAKKITPDKIIEAINNGLKNDFVMQGGYSLATMLSASVLNGLLNSTGPPTGYGHRSLPPPSLAGKTSLGELGELLEE